ncbi:hypothetical protein EON80_14255, partial [bacterium]
MRYFKAAPVTQSPLLFTACCGLSNSAHAGALLKPTNGQTQQLTARSLAVDAKLSGTFAHTTVTTIYRNSNQRRIEADFIYSAPAGSVVTGFAYWFNDEKVVARIVEKKRAARIYQSITVQRRDPALIEMIGKNSFRARISPIEAGQDLKIEIQLAQSLAATAGGARWSYPLKQDADGGALEKLSVNVQSSLPAASNIESFAGSELKIERENFTPNADLNVDVTQAAAPLRAGLYAAQSGGSDGFFALSLVSATAVQKPVLKISGVATYDVIAPKVSRLAAGQNYLVVGRYRGAGKGAVSLNGRAVQIDFPAQRSTPNVAENLWASAHLEALSANPRNQFEVAKLSKRFGIVSKWTSWLAIPDAERARFQLTTDLADQANAGRAYAQAIARRDKATATSQKLEYARLSRKILVANPGYKSPDIFDSLSAELEQMIYLLDSGQLNQSKTKQVRLYVANLKKAGAVDWNEQDRRNRKHQEREVAKRKAEYKRYLAAVETAKPGQKDALKKKSEKIFDTNYVPTYYRQYWAKERADQIAKAIWSERGKGVKDSPRQQALLKQLQPVLAEAQTNEGQVLKYAQSRYYVPALKKSYAQLHDEIKAGRDEQKTAIALRTRIKALEAKMPVRMDDFAWTTRNLSYEKANQLALQYVKAVDEGRGKEADTLKLKQRIETHMSIWPSKETLKYVFSNANNMVLHQNYRALANEIVAGRAESAKAHEMRMRIARVKEQRNENNGNLNWYESGEYLERFAWSALGHETAYRLLQA